METTQHLHGLRHRLGRKQTAAKDAFAQPRYFAVFMNFFQASGMQARDFEANRVGPDVDGGKSGHRVRISILTHRLIRASLDAFRSRVRLKLAAPRLGRTGLVGPMFTLWYLHPPSPWSIRIMGLAGNSCFGL